MPSGYHIFRCTSRFRTPLPAYVTDQAVRPPRGGWRALRTVITCIINHLGSRRLAAPVPCRGNAAEPTPPQFLLSKKPGLQLGKPANVLSDHTLISTSTEAPVSSARRSFWASTVDVEDTLEGAELELLAGFLVDESRAVDRKSACAWEGAPGPLTTWRPCSSVFTILSLRLSTRL